MRALAGPLEQLQNTALRIGQLQVQANHVGRCAPPAVTSPFCCKHIYHVILLAEAHLLNGSKRQ